LTYWPKKNPPQAKEKLKLKCQVLQYPQVKLRCTPKTLNFYCPTKGDICIKNKWTRGKCTTSGEKTGGRGLKTEKHN